MLRHLLALVLAIGLATAPLAIADGRVVADGAPPARADTLEQPACTPVTANESTPGVTGTVERAGNGSEIRITYDLPTADGPSDFGVTTIGTPIEVTRTRGFERVGSDSPAYEWNGAASPSLTYRFPVVANGTSQGSETRRYAVGSNWTLAPLPRTADRRVAYDPEPDGVVSGRENGQRIAFVGASATTNASAGCQTVSIHAPAGSDVDGDRLAAAVADAAGAYPVGQRYEHVDGVVVPLDVALGGYAVGNFFTINPASNLSTETIAVHEYVHTRQRAEYAPEMQWFVEAQPAFYMFKLRHETGRLSTARYALSLHTFHDRARWGGPFSTETSVNHYYRGAVTLAALDYRIREATDGERSLLDVVERLEASERQVTTAAFKAAVRNTTGQSMDAWVDRHVVEGEPVAVATPDRGRIPRGGWAALAAYEQAWESTPAMVAVYILVWYGLALSAVRFAGRVLSLR